MSSVTSSPGKVFKYVKVVQVSKPNISSTSHLVPVRVISSSDLQSHQSPRVEIITDQPTVSSQPAVTASPTVVIKTEPEDEFIISCQLCTKGFYNPIALKNHVANMHMDQADEVDIKEWCREYYEEKEKKKKNLEEATIEVESTPQSPTVQPKKKFPRIRQECEIDPQEVEQKKAEVMANMKPITMGAIVNEDFNYLLIKAEDEEIYGDDTAGSGGEYDEDTPKQPKKKRKRKSPSSKEDKPKQSREKTAVPAGLTGPFECLEESNVSGDGVCHQIFFSCCQYSIHYRDEHTRRRKFIKCQVCEKLLLSANEDFQYPYTCQTCGSGFEDHRDLVEHTSTSHIKIKPYQCTLCNKKFTQMGGLNQHLRMHKGERPFPCTFCPKAFTQKSGLDQHLRIHTKDKPYKCIVCSKAFIQSIHLKQHMRTHTNLAPFQCLICQKRFKQASHLNYHFKYHTQKNMNPEQMEAYKSLMGVYRSSVYGVNDNDNDDDNENEIVISEQSIVEQNEAIEHVIVQSDQLVIENDREYILSDNGDETWSVKVVDPAEV